MSVKRADISPRELHVKMPDNPSSSAVPRPKCFACGKDTPTADELRLTGRSTAKVQLWLLCPDCAEAFLRIQTDFESRWLEYKLYAKPKPSVDDFLTEKSTEIAKLKIPDWYWRWFLLHRVQHAYERAG